MTVSLWPAQAIGPVRREARHDRARRNPALFILAMVLPFPARADCPNPAAPGGTSPEGAVVYNADHNVPQFCDGATWWAMKNGGGLPACAEDDTIVMTSSGWACGSVGGGLTGPSGCANIGDLCADGTVFAGWNPITQDQLFIPTTDQGTTSAWNTSTGTNDIATDSTDG